MPKSPILGGFSTQRSKNLADNQLINLIAEIVETKDGKVPGALYNSAGLDLVYTVGSGPVRGVRDLNGLLYVVSGPNVYSVTPNGTITLCGSIGSAPTPVSMFSNTTQLLIIDGNGGWLVPGGYPLSGGAISAPGGLYAVNDTITLRGDTGTASAYPILTVQGVSNTPVTAFNMVNGGTTYTSATNVATTAIEGQPGAGKGLTLNITAASGPISAVAVASGGSGYTVGDTGAIGTGTGDAIYRVTATSGGGVTGVMLLGRGSIYSTASGVSTVIGFGVTGNAGAGFKVNIIAASGPISSASLAAGGQGYALGNTGFISGGTGDATYVVNAIGAHGTVTAFSITQPGALVEQPVNLDQKSTSGSGSGFILTTLSFGAFVGVVPVTMPFPKPIMGAVSDGFGLAIFQNSQNLAQSDQGDLSTWQALNFGIADQSSDKCAALTVIHDEAYVLKERSAEVWIDGGLAGFAFQPLTGVHMEFGCMAPFSLAKLGEVLIWLSRNDQGQGIVVVAKAYQVEPISTQALIAEFDGYPMLGDAIGYGFQQGGHSFYVLTFPEANKTWMYDLTSSQLAGVPIWSRLAAWSDGQFNRHWGNCFWNWKGYGAPITTTITYQANSVTITSPSELASATGLNGLPTSFITALLSVWLLLPDISNSTGMIFSNQTDDTHGTTNPGLFVKVQNDSTGTPEITVEAWDSTNTVIVSATYAFTNWAAWVNLLVSIDTATQVLQVYANTVVSSVLVETHLTPTAITWTSSHPIAAVATQAWHVAVV